MMTSQRTEWQQSIRAWVLAPLLVVTLTACGGGSGTNVFEAEGGSGSGGSGGGSTGGGSTTEPVPDTVTIGAMIDGTFVEGQVDVSVDILSAGGTAEVAVNLVNQDGEPVTEVNTVEFSSRCTADGTATLESPVATVGGQAVSEYVANGCAGDDEIRATVDVDGDTLTAVGTIVVEQDDIGSLQFVDADPVQIALVGTGGQETSRVRFRLLGEAGGPIEGATVNFALNSTTGGLTLTADSGVTNRDGMVSTTVRAGTVATSVRVTATETSTGIGTQSAELVVSTGIPDWDSVSISVSHQNPEAARFDGEEVEVTIRAADFFNNPVPDGTAFSFRTEGGSIDPSCTTTGTEGACSVTWRSQNPRPANHRVSILATTIGNESFTDANRNGRFDDGETFFDIGEAFADENEDGSHQSEEFFVDFSGPNLEPDGVRNGPDGEYNGVLCASDSTECSDDRSLIVSDQIVLAMSSHVAIGLMECDGTSYDEGETITVPGSGLSCTLVLADEFGNALPFETSVSADISDGWKLEGATGFAIGSGTNPISAGLSIQQDGSGSGTLTVTTSTPKGNNDLLIWSVTI